MTRQILNSCFFYNQWWKFCWQLDFNLVIKTLKSRGQNSLSKVLNDQDSAPPGLNATYPWSSYINATRKLLTVLHHKCTQLLCTPADRVPNSSTGVETAGNRWIRHDRPNFELYISKGLSLVGSFVGWFHINLLLILQTEFRSIQSIFSLPTTSLHLPRL